MVANTFQELINISSGHHNQSEQAVVDAALSVHDHPNNSSACSKHNNENLLDKDSADKNTALEDKSTRIESVKTNGETNSESACDFHNFEYDIAINAGSDEQDSNATSNHKPGNKQSELLEAHFDQEYQNQDEELTIASLTSLAKRKRVNKAKHVMPHFEAADNGEKRHQADTKFKRRRNTQSSVYDDDDEVRLG